MTQQSYISNRNVCKCSLKDMYKNINNSNIQLFINNRRDKLRYILVEYTTANTMNKLHLYTITRIILTNILLSQRIQKNNEGIYYGSIYIKFKNRQHPIPPTPPSKGGRSQDSSYSQAKQGRWHMKDFLVAGDILFLVLFI